MLTCLNEKCLRRVLLIRDLFIQEDQNFKRELDEELNIWRGMRRDKFYLKSANIERHKFTRIKKLPKAANGVYEPRAKSRGGLRRSSGVEIFPNRMLHPFSNSMAFEFRRLLE